jgi:hypothetical protein
MASKFKLPIARVLCEEDAASVDDIFAKANIRLLAVDLTALRLTKSYAALRKQAAEWSDAEVENFLLSKIAEGPV